MTAMAHADELRDRGIEPPSGAAPKVENLEPPLDATPALGIGLAGSFIASRAAESTIMGKRNLNEDPIGKKLLRFAKGKGVKWQKSLDTRNAWAGDGVVSTHAMHHPSVLAHEIGHATGSTLAKKISNKLYGPALIYSSRVLPLLTAATYAGVTDAGPGATAEERKKAMTRGQLAMGAVSIPYLPALAEEARASGRASVLVGKITAKSRGKLRGVLSGLGTAARLAPAYATYLGGAGAPIAGAALLQLKKSQIDDQERKIAKKKANAFDQKSR